MRLEESMSVEGEVRGGRKERRSGRPLGKGRPALTSSRHHQRRENRTGHIDPTSLNSSSSFLSVFIKKGRRPSASSVEPPAPSSFVPPSLHLVPFHLVHAVSLSTCSHHGSEWRQQRVCIVPPSFLIV